MKKALASLLLAAMVFSTAGCGGQKVDEVKDGAAAVVDEAKDKADAAAAAVGDAANKMKATVDDAAALMKNIKDGANEKNAIALGGIVPGINLEAVTDVYGQPIETNGNVLAFENGLDAKIDSDNRVEEISTTYEGIQTPAGIEVGSPDTDLNSTYGQATQTETDGAVTYKYLSPDNRWAISFVTRDGVITEIRCGLNN